MVEGLSGAVKWRVYLYGVPAMAWAALLLATAVARDLGPIEDIDVVPSQDKLVHFLEYLVLAFLAFFALVRGTHRSREWQMWTAFLAAAAYGVFLELLQMGVPGRETSALDMAANTLGALAGAFVASRLLEPVAIRNG